MQRRRTGELTLHHYDEIGLLVPSERSGDGYRLYCDGDCRRLYRILALRGRGFSLEDIRATLDREGDDPRSAVHRQLEQLDQIEQRRRALGEEGMQRAHQDWADLIAEVDAERAAGTDPADPRVQALMVRWNDLIEQFTGGDAGIRASLQRMYEDKGVERGSRGTLDAETTAHAQRAIAARRP